MDSRKTVLDALNHRRPARIPVDFGGTAVSGMHVSCVAALREFYGLEKTPVKVVEPYQMLGEIGEDLREIIGIDTRLADGFTNMFGFRQTGWKPWRTPQGLEVLVPIDFRVTEDSSNIYMYPQGDFAAPPSAKMPKSGYFFDTIIRQPEIDEDNLNPLDNLEEFAEISNEALEAHVSGIKKAREMGGAVIANPGGTALGDIALVPAPFMKNPRGIRDVAEWYISTAIRQDFVHEIFEKQTEIAIKNLGKINKSAGEMIDIVYVCGTDFGTQISTFCSAETYKSLYMPYYQKINGWIHANTRWRTFKHSCGAVEPFIPLFIESGFDILNPVQCSAAGMTLEILKKKYGGKIVFWGGGVDTQRTLPFGTPEDVRREVLERCRIFGDGGGFVFGAIHNVQARTPVENIAAMISAVREFNGERL